MARSTRARSTTDIAGHGFRRWEPVRELAEEDRGRAERIAQMQEQDDLSLNMHERLLERLQQLEGGVRPVCECGWRGYDEAWVAPKRRSVSGGQQHIEHKHLQKIYRAQREHDAGIAADALRLAADNWAGAEDVSHWLVQCAERIEDLGDFEGEIWPDVGTTS